MSSPLFRRQATSRILPDLQSLHWIPELRGEYGETPRSHAMPYRLVVV